MEETTNWALALELLLMSLIFSLQIGMQNSSLSLSKFSSFFFVELSYLIPFKLFFGGFNYDGYITGLNLEGRNHLAQD
jgi:hypothetical protein